MRNILVLLSILGLALSSNATQSQASQTQAQSGGNCAQALSQAQEAVAAAQRGDTGAEALAAARALTAANGGQQLNAVQNAQGNVDNALIEITAKRMAISEATTACKETCAQLAADLRANSAQAAAQNQAQLAADLEAEAARVDGDGQSCGVIEESDGGQMDMQAGELMQMLPALMQLASMFAQQDPSAPEAAMSDQERCINLAQERQEAGGTNDALNNAYADLCARMADQSAVALGTTGGSASGGLESSRLGALAARGEGVDQSFQGGLEKNAQAAKVNTPSGGGSANLAGGRGGAVAGGKGRGRRGGKKLKTDILKGTSGGGISGGSSARGGSYGGGGRRGMPRRNADRMQKANLKQYLPGGKKYRGPASAAAKKGEVSAALGPSNFDKISQRYKKVQPSLLP